MFLLNFLLSLGNIWLTILSYNRSGGGCRGLAASAISDGQQKALFTHAGEFK